VNPASVNHGERLSADLELEAVQNPFDTSVSMSSIVIDMQKNLVGECCGQYLCSVVLQTEMPVAVVEIKLFLPMIVERAIANF
jgi:hypothetical protein